MADLIIYHNDMCNKSKAALEMLEQWDIPHKVRRYMDDRLTIDELKAIAKKLDTKPSLLVRKNTSVYIEQYADKDISEDEWLQIIVNEPMLLERPIVEKGNKAVIARPAEKFFDLLD